jgi:hypothetical protein
VQAASAIIRPTITPPEVIEFFAIAFLLQGFKPKVHRPIGGPTDKSPPAQKAYSIPGAGTRA